ncbi:MAG: ABC transporter ATP-binding protein [Pseudomonadales bacterium]|nr:ABC transporter ATP-binding protein [Pseudomonadales bacterium]
MDCQQLSKYYQQAETQLLILDKVSFSLSQGQTAAIIGSSGAGKSTLLNLLGGLDRASSGDIFIDGENLAGLDNQALSVIRNQKLGFVYQFHHLLQEFDALENVAMPLLIRGMARKQAFQQAREVLAQVGLAARAEHRPQALSGGERQRVAIARAIVAKPACVLMDEPTGNLDEATAQDILALLQTLNQQYQQSFIIVTHDKAIAEAQDKCYQLSQGQLRLQDQ